MKKRISKIKLGTDKDHTRSILRNLANSLILHESISISKTKAKAVIPFVERLITIGKRGTTIHQYRIIFDRLRNKDSANKLISKIIPRMKDRDSGFIRILKSHERSGDNSLMYLVLFVDYEPKSKRVRLSKKNDKNPKINDNVSKPETTAEGKKGLLDRFRGKKRSTNKSQIDAKTSKSKVNSRSGI